jgi:hypothetical protein
MERQRDRGTNDSFSFICDSVALFLWNSVTLSLCIIRKAISRECGRVADFRWPDNAFEIYHQWARYFNDLIRVAVWVYPVNDTLASVASKFAAIPARMGFKLHRLGGVFASHAEPKDRTTGTARLQGGI